ncbi:MAG: transposase [Candidatus Thiodiazotropha sp. DIVDIV]
MPRKPRFYLPDIPAHVIQRGNSRQPVFFESCDYQAYLTWLKEGADKHGCAIHAYCLMTNHVHLLLTPGSSEAISKTIQFVGRHYVPYINHTYGKSGTLWEGRHKGCVVDSDEYLLNCMRYIELNPVRAGMVKDPIDYRWSSYRGNATHYTDELTIPHALYSQLAKDCQNREFVYRELFRITLQEDHVHDIRATVQTGTPLGNARFHKQIENQLKCKVGQAKRGRPEGRKTER